MRAYFSKRLSHVHWQTLHPCSACAIYVRGGEHEGGGGRIGKGQITSAAEQFVWWLTSSWRVVFSPFADDGIFFTVIWPIFGWCLSLDIRLYWAVCKDKKLYFAELVFQNVMRQMPNYVASDLKISTMWNLWDWLSTVSIKTQRQAFRPLGNSTRLHNLVSHPWDWIQGCAEN